MLSYVAARQGRMEFVCGSVTVTVGEGRYQSARHYSGRYGIHQEKIKGRPVYIQEQGKGAFLAYCKDNGINRWTISPLDEREAPKNPCTEIQLKSERTIAFDVTEVGELKYWTGDDADAHIKCNECDESKWGGDCSFVGTCSEKKLCLCNPGFFGEG